MFNTVYYLNFLTDAKPRGRALLKEKLRFGKVQEWKDML